MKNKSIIIVAFAILTSFVRLTVKAQTSESPSPFKVTADVVSSYIFRGSMATAGPTPNFQPTLSYSKGKYEIGIWGSTDFAGTYKEFDPYISVTPGQLKFGITDYNWNFSKSYFDYSSTTDHIYEATLAYTGAAFSAQINTMFAGADKLANGNNAFSTYAELGYQINPIAKVFLGAALTESPSVYFTKGFGVTNVGLKISKSIAITDKFSLPVYGIVGANPYSGNAFFVAGVTL